MDKRTDWQSKSKRSRVWRPPAYRLPGVAWGAWAIVIVVGVAIGGTLDTAGASSSINGLRVGGLTMLAFLLLFAMKIADRWEKGDQPAFRSFPRAVGELFHVKQPMPGSALAALGLLGKSPVPAP